MDLKYDLKLTDVINFYLYTGRGSKINLRRMRNKKIKLFLITLVISLVLQWLYLQSISSIYYVFSLIIALLPVILFSFYMEWLIARKFRKFHKNSREPNLFGTYHLAINHDGLEEIVDGGQKVLYEWKDIKTVVRVKNYIYIYMDDIRAVIVPVRIFSTKDEYLYFLKELKRYIMVSTNQSLEVKNH